MDKYIEFKTTENVRVVINEFQIVAFIDRTGGIGYSHKTEVLTSTGVLYMTNKTVDELMQQLKEQAL